jgi:uncharacterized hydrophobic protein (TIGR00271 family)
MTTEKEDHLYEDDDIDVIPPRPDDFLPTWLDRVRDLFSLHLDTDAAGMTDSLKKSVIFQGGNLWALIFAALIASIGLNTNSTAVIIGAMLISPLMGPIVGIGYSAGTNDFEFLKISARNLALMVGLSLTASILYFLLSPLKEATPELLARMRPNLYDVLIATFGGAVGIVASSRRDRGTAIPGVAIATALMPPLCTAGYGIATGDFGAAFGAFYLFFINSVFIALTSMLFVRLLGFPQKEFIDKQREKNVRILISAIVTLTIIPSIFTAYHVVREAVFMNRAAVFVEENLKFENTTILKPFTRTYGSDTALIEVILIGEPLAEQVVGSIQKKLEDPRYGLAGTKLVLRQSNNVDSYYGGNINSTMVESVFKEKDKTIEEQRNRIAELEKTGGSGGGGNKTGGSSLSQKELAELTKKLSAVFPEITQIAYSEALQVGTDGGNAEIINMVFITVSKDLDESSQTRVSNFIKLEIGMDNIKVVMQ